ncbi:MAG TPA: acyl-CoA dehydrogenase [Sphingobium sp.]|uniref:acyl-CoA dehydrogenase n=1 Tax=Sphingobium sp. TaxID=1912891 RepID=UPI002ED3F2AF
MSYSPRTADQCLALRINAGIEELSCHERFAALTPDIVEAFVEGIGTFAAEEFAPLNRIGDIEGASLADGKVQLPPGFAEAYRSYVSAGWNGASAGIDHGGQGLPFALSCCVLENLGTANMAFSLLPMLTLGALDAVDRHGSDELKNLYLAKLASGEWPGTMNLTEPQAGSDVGALRTRAIKIEQGDDKGRYLISGTKIFITWGDHELADNIVHLVLARTPDAPEGSKGISLFLVPKFHVTADGSPGVRNDVRTVGLEHKLGIHASPTCVMSYGDDGRCIGDIVGRENEGLKAMFTMMNSARISVGNQGVQIAERALQQALSYASDRIQSPRAGAADRAPVAIIEHPDVRRMLLRMRALTEAARALLYYTAGQIDRGGLDIPGAQQRAEVLVPMLKAWGTDIGFEVASLGVQVHGGMGFIEETGAAQHLRDARIPPIYEGTNGIQAADLVTRKLGFANGAVIAQLFDDIIADSADTPPLRDLARACRELSCWLIAEASLDDRLGGSVPFLTMCAVAVAGWQLLKQARAVGALGDAGPAALSKPVISRFFIEHIVPEAGGLAAQVRSSSALLYALDRETLAAL